MSISCSIEDLETPAVILDVNRLHANMKRYQLIADNEDVRLRPHVKTTKCPQIWQRQAGYGAKGFTAATVKEAETLVATGEGAFRDVLIAFPHVDPFSLVRIGVLAEMAKIGLLIANKEGAQIAHNALQGSQMPEVYVAVDTGLHREGVNPYAKDAIETVKLVRDLFGEKFRGILTHAGHVYRKTSHKLVARIAASERDQMIAFARACENQDVDVPEISIGSTPTVFAFKNKGHRITEIRPGNYALMDNIQVDLGVAKPDQCALSVLATVVDKRKLSRKKGDREDHYRLIVGAGSKVLSSDTRPHSEGGKVYGRVYADMAAMNLLDRVFIDNLSEEHGWINCPATALNSGIAKIGSRIRILVQHACTVMNLAGAGKAFVYIADEDRVIDKWPIIAAGH